jgi:hypothetical protein
MLPPYFAVNLYRSFQIVSSVPRGTTARPLQSFARNKTIVPPVPFCIRFVSVFFHPKLNVCKKDLWCLKWRHARTRIQQSVSLTKFSRRFCKIEAPQSSSGTQFFSHTSLFALCKNFIPLLWSGGDDMSANFTCCLDAFVENLSSPIVINYSAIASLLF